MRIHLYHSPWQPRHLANIEAMRDGLLRHGESPTILDIREYRAADLSVVWSAYNTGLFREDFLVMERGYIDRRNWVSVGYNGLNGRAEFYKQPSPRHREFDDLIRPWRRNGDGDGAVIMGQVFEDASLRNVDYMGFLSRLPKTHRGKRVSFRPHPSENPHRYDGHPLILSNLADCLSRCSEIWTFSSNSAVDALLAGVPAVTFDRGSIVYDYTSHEVGAIVHADRRRMVNELTWCQWTPREISAGDAWEHLRQRWRR